MGIPNLEWNVQSRYQTHFLRIPASFEAFSFCFLRYDFRHEAIYLSVSAPPAFAIG